MPTIRTYIDDKTLKTGAIDSRQWIDLVNTQTSPSILDAGFIDFKYQQGGGVFAYSYIDDTSIYDTYDSFNTFIDHTNRLITWDGVNVRKHVTLDAALTLHTTHEITSFGTISQYHVLPQGYALARYRVIDSRISGKLSVYYSVDSEITDRTAVRNHHDISLPMVVHKHAQIDSAIRSKVTAYHAVSSEILSPVV